MIKLKQLCASVTILLVFCCISQTSLHAKKSAGEIILQRDFSEGMADWKISYGDRMVSVVNDETDKKLLQLTDDCDRDGVGVESPFIPARRGMYYLKGKLRILNGFGPGISIEFFDSAKNMLGRALLSYSSRPLNPGEWQDFRLEAAAANEDIAFLRIKFASWKAVVNKVQFDDIELSYHEPHPVPPLWEPQYKLKSSDKLTAADVLAPDGIVYPDWSRAGVRGDIPDLSALPVVNSSDFGAKPDDDQDDSQAILRAITALTPGGGIVQLEAGEYNFSRLIRITADNVIIRGRGMDKTFVRCDYAIPADCIDFYNITEGQRIGPQTYIHVYCKPKGLNRIRLTLNNVEIGNWKRSAHSGNSFSLVARSGQVNIAPGAAQLVAEAEYVDGNIRRKTLNIIFDPARETPGNPDRPAAAILFAGKGLVGEEIALAADGRRGDTSITLVSADHGLKAGDMIRIQAPETPRRRKEIRNACNWGTYRSYLVYIAKVNGANILLDQPLRIDYPVIDGSWIRKIEVISGGGVCDMTLEAKENLWLTTVKFRNAVDCWAWKLKVIKTGRNPVYTRNAKFCTIRDCVFDDAWFKGGGGTAYVGWEHSYDCLMEKITSYKMRHAPLLQWSAAGNVIRDSVFHQSDAQWHSGWTNENLIENCVIDSTTTENGGYGHGMWASPPEDGAHGPNGPRNVVYNCDVTSLKNGVWLGGMNENWLILYNRFKVGKGAGIYVKTHSFDHIIAGNTFILKDKTAPMLFMNTPDCSGIEVKNNIVYGGSGKLAEGLSDVLLKQGNRILPFQSDAPRPQPALPSIFTWQRTRKNK
ncbi:MAG: right-handed parallel beta-helix repeat-containing protein [Victivallales bacterium]|nr:right-handed parallel beta-helix repeat-containing protein [Victivallales bacterium]